MGDFISGFLHCRCTSRAHPFAEARESAPDAVRDGVCRELRHTADDTSHYTGRNPLAWRLQGSNDGKNWIDLDVVGCANPHTFDKTLAYSRRLDVPREPPDNAVIYPVRTSDGRRLVSYDVNGTTIHELAPDAR